MIRGFGGGGFRCGRVAGAPRCSPLLPPRPSRDWVLHHDHLGLLLSARAAGIGVFCQTFVGALFAQLYSIVSDGTPLRLAQVNWPCSLLCLTMGMIPFALRDRGKAAAKPAA